MLSWQELLVIFLIVLLLFGAKRIPEIAKALGKGAREFRKAKDEITRETEAMMDAAGKHAEQQEKQTVEVPVDNEEKQS
jgi:sec-independent protein translocase protein TatA